MSKENKVVVIDAGNTSVKIAVFLDDEIIELQRVDNIIFFQDNFDFSKFESLRTCRGILSSVLSEQQNQSLFRYFPNLIQYSGDLKLSVSIDYQTPNSLGQDRICNAVAIHHLKNTKNAVSIDVGTCLKFDLVLNETYTGGSISPGLRLRYESLNKFTAKLPLLSPIQNAKLVGDSTNSSIHAGVMLGMEAEIIQNIERYNQMYDDLTFFVTGGDAKYFDLHSKNNIFANENLTLEGLYQIYLFNDQ